MSGPKREKIRGTGVLWKSWLWVSWFIGPAAFVLRSVLGVGGWESLFFVLFSPVIIPALGLLGALPRFVLKRRGHRSIPASVGVTAIASCWGLVLFMCAMPGTTDSSPIDSVVRQALGLSGRAENTLLGFAFVVWVAAYLVTAVLSFVLRPVPPSDAQSARYPGRTRLAAILAIVLVPVLLVSAALAVDRLAMHGARDFGGATEADVAFLPPDAQRARQEAQWDAAQEALAPLRSAIAQDGWHFTGRVGVDADTTGIEPLGYTVETHWNRDMPGTPESVAAGVREAAEQHGWRLQEPDRHAFNSRPGEPGVHWEDDSGNIELVQLDFSNDQGYRLTVWAELPETDEATEQARDFDATAIPEAASSKLRLALSSGEYWQSRGEQFEWWEVQRPDATVPATFAGDEWPALDSVAAAAEQ